MMQSYQVEMQLNVDASAGDLGEVAFQWLDGMSLTLAPQARAEVAGLPERIGREPSSEPGAVTGRLVVSRWPVGRPARLIQRNPSDAGMRWLRGEMKDVPRKAQLILGHLHDLGLVTSELASIQVNRHPVAADWLQLLVGINESELTDAVHGREAQQRYLDALWPFADRLNPGFGQIAYSINDGATAFETCLRNLENNPPKEWWLHPYTIPHCREFLRGYAWLTMVPAELVARLGDVDSLAGTGAFAEVRPLTHGGVWLLATHDYREFTDHALHRVFRVLAPVLRPGPLTDWPRMPGKAPLRVVFENAADVGTR